MRGLAEAGWIGISQVNQLAPVRFTLRNPEQDRSAAELAKAKQRLRGAGFRGEAIMKEYLSLLIDSNLFRENAKPDFLVNPLTEERMELVRYYPPVAGSTVCQPGGPDEAAGTGSDEGGALCTPGIPAGCGPIGRSEPGDDGEKVGTCLPLRDLTGLDELVRYLQKVGRQYWSQS